MPLSAPRPRRRRSTPSARVVAELAAGLLLGVVGGWVVGLVRVRAPKGAA